VDSRNSVISNTRKIGLQRNKCEWSFGIRIFDNDEFSLKLEFMMKIIEFEILIDENDTHPSKHIS
jgi:hypothetical protein